jgi:hypothetical protein
MRRIPFEIWLTILIMAAHLYVAFLPANSLVNWFHSDDAFYYFKVAQNITEGHGITFDRLGRDSGFHPLWMAMVTPIFALARYSLILPLRLVVLLSALLSAGTAVLLYRLAKRMLHPYAAVFIAFLWAFHPLIHANITEMGLESPLSAFFIALLIYRLVQEHEAPGPSYLRWLLTGFIGALTILARLDNVFIVLVAGIWLAFPPVRLRYLLVSDLVLIVFGVLAVNFLRVGLGPPAIPYMLSGQVMVVVALAVRILLYYLFGLYRVPDGYNDLLWQMIRAVMAALLATVVISAVMLTAQALDLFPGFPRLVLLMEGVYALAAVLITRLAAYLLGRRLPPDEPLRWAPVFARAVSFFLPVGLILVGYMGASYLYFGTFMPVSGQIKRWWGTLYTIYGHPIRSIAQMAGFFNLGPWDLILRMMRFPAEFPALARLALWSLPAALLLLRRGYRTQILRTLHGLAIYPLFAGGFIQLLFYTGTSYTHTRVWYWVAQFMLVTLLLGMLLDSLLKWVESLTAGHQARLWSPTAAITTALCLLILISGAADVVRRMPMTVPPEKAGYYLLEARTIEESTEPGAFIGFTGGGTTAYFIQDRTIVNLDGLMNTYEYFQMLKNWQAADYLDGIGLQYVVAREYVVTRSEPYTQIAGRLEEISHIGENTFFRWRSVPDR